MTAKSDKRRLQELFEQYDASGDGVLSEEEMLKLFEHLGVPRKQAEDVFKAADSNRDGTIQVHEFIAWLTAMKPNYGTMPDLKADGTGSIQFAVSNATKYTMKFTFKFLALENCAVMGEGIDARAGNVVQVVVPPGKRSIKTMLRVLKAPHSYEVVPVCSVAEMDNGTDDISKAFIDEDFPHDERSTKSGGGPVADHDPDRNLGNPDRWVRARMLGNSSDAVLFDQVRPQDIRQGHVGDCFFLASLSALAQQPQHLKRLFSEKHMTEDGKYTVKLYHMEKKEWVKVVIDEFVPCKSVDGILRPCTAQPLGEEIWVPLLEKAVAKFVGGYGELYGGMESWVFTLLTGQTPEVLQKMDKGWVSYMSRGMKARDPRSGRPRRNRDKKPMDAEQLFQYLSGACADKHILSCSVNFLGGKPISSAEDAAQVTRQYGVYSNHAYALLKCFEEKLDNGQPIRFVQIRNPWGCGEWKGDWADFSREKLPDCWEKNPELKKRLNVKNQNDGLFYMSFEDFTKVYTGVQLCPVGTKPIPSDETLEEDVPDEEKGFFASMFGSFW